MFSRLAFVSKNSSGIQTKIDRPFENNPPKTPAEKKRHTAYPEKHVFYIALHLAFFPIPDCSKRRAQMMDLYKKNHTGINNVESKV